MIVGAQKSEALRKDNTEHNKVLKVRNHLFFLC